jgi:hypothetical protein
LEKQTDLKWFVENYKKDERNLLEIEEHLNLCYNKEGFGLLLEDQKNEITLLEDKREIFC